MGKKFTFRKDPRETGLAGVGNPYPNTNIKWEKKVVGCISAPSWNTTDNKWGIRLMVKKDERPGWAWVRLKARFDTEPEAREFLNENVEKLVVIGLHQDAEWVV